MDALNDLEQNVNFVQNLKYCLSQEKFRTNYILLSMEEIRLKVESGLNEFYDVVMIDPQHHEFFDRRMEEGMDVVIKQERLKTLTIFLSKIIKFGDIGIKYKIVYSWRLERILRIF